jgi:DNA mismatch repair protein MutS
MPVLMMSGHATIDTAVEATRIGAIDFLEKPIALAKLLADRLEPLSGEMRRGPKLKVGYNQVFGYYLELSKSATERIPAHFIRKQTLVNAERFTTPELKELEVKILEAEERILAIEKELFQELRAFMASFAGGIRQTATALSELDVMLSLAEVAVGRRYVRPRFSDSGEFRVAGGRHPVVERLVEADAARFIPNDLYLDNQKFVAVITGPNMGGKSTYLRQAAMLSILAQESCSIMKCQNITSGWTRSGNRVRAILFV